LEKDNEILISGRYRIVKKIASGGMADIYLGDDLELKRRVAVKVLSANYAGDRNFVARFRREAQVLAGLNHPNIVDIYDWGKFNSSYYIVMEYIEGISLKELIERKGFIKPDTAAEYAIQICDALRAAHDNNLIHRDIKPQNILISQDGKIKVTDFGIAKSLNTDITKTLNIVGTAHYISPEQARGDVLDNRTDI
jgi:serine/threonine-protein kinase